MPISNQNKLSKAQIGHLQVCLASQKMHAYADEQLLASYSISSARNGAGERKNSGCTPRGRHYIRAKIGASLPLHAVLVGRRWTGEICTPALVARQPERDWITSRILWLSGCESGRNRGGNVDSFARYIYIHGTPELDLLGTPVSHGCIRMDDRELIELFAAVRVGTTVEIG